MQLFFMKLDLLNSSYSKQSETSDFALEMSNLNRIAREVDVTGLIMLLFALRFSQLL